MAIAIASKPVNMDGALTFVVGEATAASSYVYLDGLAGESWRLSGSFTTSGGMGGGYGMDGDDYGTPATLTGGTVTSAAYNDGSGLVLSITELTHGALAIQGYVVAYDDQGLLGYLFNGNDVMTGSSGADVAHGYDGADKVKGAGGNDVLTGDAGDDTLTGGPGADTLSGGAGIDRLEGGKGADLLNGGSEVDRFVFDTAPTTPSADTVASFVHLGDRILLDNAVFTGLGANGPLAASAFHAGTNAHDATDRIIYDAAAGKLYYDADGQGGVTRVLVAIFTDPPVKLTAADFQII